MKKVLAMILCMVLIVTMTACSGGGSETEVPGTTAAANETAESGSAGSAPTKSEPTEPESTEPVTEPEPTAGEIYDQALALLKEMKSMKLEINATRKTTLGSDEFNEKSIQTLLLQNISTDSFAASLTDTTYRGTYCTKSDEIFIDGSMYYHVTPQGESRVNYSTVMTAEEYLERMIPAQLLEAELYETLEKTSEKSISFSGANALESWIGEAGAELEEVSGTAELDENGALSKSTYVATYYQGAAKISCEVTVTVSADAGEAIAAPADADSYRVLEGEAYYGPYLLQHAIGYISQMDTLTSVATESAVTAAAGWSYVYQETVNAFSGVGTQLAKIDYLYQLADINTGEYYFNDVVKEEYANGVYTYIENDKLPETYELQYRVIADNIEASNVMAIPYQSNVESFEVGNYSGTILVEYQLVDTLDKDMSTGVAGLMFADPNFLDDLATAYRTEEAVGYIGIDAATGIPTAVGFDYTGIHTIEGVEYQLIYALARNFQVGHDSTYETITGEPPAKESEGDKATPLFYKVTGANGQEMWLMGTIHVGDERTANLPLEIRDAFDASDALAVEFDTNAFEERMETDQEYAMQIAQLYMYTDGTTTQDHIEDPEVYEYATKLMKAAGLMDMYTTVYKASIWSQNIDNYSMRWNYDLSGDQGMDSQLLAWAEEQNKEIRDVESALSQIQMITGYSDALQEWILAGSLSTTPSEYVKQTNELYEMWCAGDEAELIAYLADSDTSEMTDEELVLYQEYTKAMETDRNAAMLEVAKQYLESGDVVFYAVGLAHLLAEDGLVNTLRDAGYTVELVPYS